MGNLPIHSNSLVKFHNFNSIMINGQVDNLLFLFLFSLNHPFFPCALPTFLIIAWCASASLSHHTPSSSRHGAEPSLGFQHHSPWVGHRKMSEEVCVEGENEWRDDYEHDWSILGKCVCRWLSHISNKRPFWVEIFRYFFTGALPHPVLNLFSI